MKLLVLGGTGFVSGALCRLALEQGHEVWAVTRGQKEAVEGVRMLIADRSDEASLTAAVARPGIRFDAVLDCICFNSDHARIDLTVLPKVTDRLVVISTDSVYHPAHKRVPQNEDSDFYLEDGGYGAQKRQMELTFQNAQTELHWTIFRPGHIFGPGSQLGCYPNHSRQPDLLQRMLRDEPLELLGGGSFLIHPVYVDDLAQAMLSCIPLPGSTNRIFCIGGPDIVSNARYFEILGELIGHPAHIVSLPLEGALEANPGLSGNLCDRAYDLTRLREAGITVPSTPLAEGLQKQVEWIAQRDGILL